MSSFEAAAEALQETVREGRLLSEFKKRPHYEKPSFRRKLKALSVAQ